IRSSLDQNGDETLVVNGDMLCLPPGKSELLRVQGAFISTEETERVMEWYKRQGMAARLPGKPSIDEQVEAIGEEKQDDDGEPAGSGPGERASLLGQAA